MTIRLIFLGSNIYDNKKMANGDTSDEMRSSGYGGYGSRRVSQYAPSDDISPHVLTVRYIIQLMYPIRSKFHYYVVLLYYILHFKIRI